MAPVNSFFFAPLIGGTSKLVAIRATGISVAGATPLYNMLLCYYKQVVKGNILMIIVWINFMFKGNKRR